MASSNSSLRLRSGWELYKSSCLQSWQTLQQMSEWFETKQTISRFMRTSGKSQRNDKRIRTVVPHVNDERFKRRIEKCCHFIIVSCGEKYKIRIQ